MNKVEVTKIVKNNNKRHFANVMLWSVIACASLLFIPQHILQKLALAEFVSQNSHFIGLGMLVGIAYFLSQMLSFFADESIAYLKEKKVTENIESKVQLLDPSERALLREFFLQGATILTLPQNELAVKNLVATNILEMLGNERHYAIQGPTAEYKISMQARHYLNRDVLRLPSGEPSQEEMTYLMKARPQFINGLVQARKHAA
ncbi:superinfection exclusion B family protein [Shewanella maritima]|uniref:superinfection exclusion B family protein n=1 Tax=Shewanella maritima TaxID=2520507 RepID=UPI0037352CB1